MRFLYGICLLIIVARGYCEDRGSAYSVAVLTYSHINSLEQVIERFVSAPRLRHVHVMCQKTATNDDLLSKMVNRRNWTSKIRVHSFVDNPFIHRFDCYKDIETNAVLTLDDDMFVTIDLIEEMFDAWRHNQERLVGPVARMCTSANAYSAQSENTGTYNLILTGISFVHVRALEAFTKAPPRLLSFVRDHINGEDILMNFIVGNFTKGSSGIVFDADPYILQHREVTPVPEAGGALSHRQKHYEDRGTLCRLCREVYGYELPLTREFVGSFRQRLFYSKIQSLKRYCP